MSAKNSSALFVLLLSGLTPTLIFGQAITGTVVGTVTDSSGAVLVDAKVTATNQDTGIGRESVTDAQGNYVVPSLSPGIYKISVTFRDFRTGVSANNVVQVNQTARVDFTLTPGAVTEQVNVVAEAPLVESTTSEIGQVIDRNRITSMPLNGRLFEQLVTLTPGTVQAGFADFGEDPAAAGARSPVNSTVNGMPWSGNKYTIDGVNNSEPLNAFINLTPPLEAIEEFKVQTNNPSAEFGSFGGAVVNLTMRSGANELHGSAFEYVRNDVLNARNFFAVQKAPFKTNQFGGTVSGPIVRNRLFFFGDYQGLRERLGRTFLITVPTQLQRQGILTEGNQPPIFDPLTGQQFAGNVIPTAGQNPVAQKAAQVWPSPNLPGLANNFVTNNSLSENVHQFDVKVDWQRSDREHVFGRESLAQRRLADPPPGNIFLMTNPNADSRNQNAVLGYTRTFSPTQINEFRLGFNRFAVTQVGSDFGQPKNNDLGIPNGNIPGLPYTFGIAQFNIPGFYSTGSPGFGNSQRIANIFEYTDNFTWIRSKHTLKFGADIQQVQSTLTNPQSQPRGLFEFDGNFTSNRGASGTGSGWASFLLGYPRRVVRDFVDTRPAVRMLFAGFYAQDDYRITQKLTLNLGLRWDLFTRPVEKFNRQTNFNLTTGLIDAASPDNRAPNVDNFLGSWAPRVGLAYSPDRGKTAFRAAYGISYFPDNFGATGGTLERNYPLFLINEFITPDRFTPSRSLSDGLPGFQPVLLQPHLTPPPNFSVFEVSRNFRQDMSQMWNLSVDRQLSSSVMVEAAYVATKGSHIFRNLDLNVPFPGPGPIPPRRPFFNIAPNIPSINQRNGDGASSYQSAQFKVVKRYSSGLTMLVSYTVSKSIDNYSQVLFPYNDKLNRGLSAGFKATDIPQNFVFSYSYELPIGRGKAWLSNGSGLVDRLVSGWSVNGITTLRRGSPLVINVASSQLNTGTGNRADITCAQVGTPKRVNAWFDTGCFVNPAPLVFGNSGIGHVRGPGLDNWDFSLFKSNRLDEKRRLDFSAEFFNLFNMAHFSNPNTTLGSAAFGTISSTSLPPREIQLGLKFIF